MVAAEARQCPTLLQNGFGAHRIEGIGDKHVPWVHNVRNTDAVAAIDDEDCMRLFRLFNEPAGRERLAALGMDAGAGRAAADCWASPASPMSWPRSRPPSISTWAATTSSSPWPPTPRPLVRARAWKSSRPNAGAYTPVQAACDLERCLWGQGDDHFKELTYADRKAIHNLKYFTWVEQQGKEIADLNQLWQDRELWPTIFGQVERWDEMIRDFNERTGLLKNLS